MVMLITMGAFGNLKNIIHNDIYNIRYIHNLNNNNNNLNDLKLNIGLYLAGLIEGNGTIVVHNNFDKNRYSLLISIIFKSNDKLQLDYLYNKLNIGKILTSKTNTYYIWQINKIEDTYILLYIINGYFRTLKIESLIKAINWINMYIYQFYIKNNIENLKGLNKYNYIKQEMIIKSIDYLNLITVIDNSLLDSNNWLSGFTDANGNFFINLNTRKNGNYRLIMEYSLEIRNNFYNLDQSISILDIYNLLNKNIVEIRISYFDIMKDISNLFNTGLYIRTKKLKNKGSYKECNSYIIRTGSIYSLSLVNNYFNNYSLLSSKNNDYKDWKILFLLLVKYGSTYLDCIKLAREIKYNFNSIRTYFNWDHLK